MYPPRGAKTNERGKRELNNQSQQQLQDAKAGKKQNQEAMPTPVQQGWRGVGVWSERGMRRVWVPVHWPGAESG